MSNKIIDLNALSEYKTRADQKYQDKITAGTSISLNNNVISLAPTYVKVSFEHSSTSVANNTVVSLGSVTLAPGNYIFTFTCHFSEGTSSTGKGYRQCGFTTNVKYLDGFGSAFWDSRRSISGINGLTMISGSFSISASAYPDGRTFYFVAKQNSGYDVTVEPSCYYIKF